MKNLLKRVWACGLALVLVLGLTPTEVLAAEVDATEIVTSISSVDDLIAFRDSVNSGVEYAGKTVELLADIDMAGIDWSVNIGDDCNYVFDGTFEGNGHTIKNLSSTEKEQKPGALGDQYVCTGLFGALYGPASVKNLTLENVNINTGAYTGVNASALVGFAYSVTGTISNVKVTGTINAEKIDGVGAIVGYVYSGNPTIENCTVEANVNGQAFVGGIVGYGGKAKVANCTVNNSVINSNCCAAGVMGLSLSGAVLTDNTVNNVSIATAHANWKNSAAVAVGSKAGSALTVSGTNCANVTLNGADSNVLVGSVYANQPENPVAAIEASVNGVYYNTLQEAIDAAEAGATVKLDANIVADGTYTIAADDVIVLDLNGKTLSAVDTITASYGLINVKKGNLTVKDSVGTGKITLSATNNRGWNAYSSVISNQQGVVTVESGTIEHTGGTDMAYAIDNLTNGGIGDATLNINGGKIVSSYRAIRQFANSASKINNLFITGGEIISTTNNRGAVWVQSSNASANKATLSITGGHVSAVLVSAPNNASEFNIMIADGCVDAIEENVQAGYDIQVKVNNVNTNVTLQEAINTAGKGETIALAKDIVLDTPVTIGEGKEIVLDLNGKTLSGVDTITASYGLINVKKGNLTVKDSVGTGKITLSATNNRGWNAYSSAISNQQGVVTVESGTIEHTGGTDMAYAIDNLTNGGIGDATLYINGGKIVSSYRAIRQFANSASKTNSLYITGGEVTSTSGNKAVWVQSSNNSANKATLSITGGKVSSLYVYAPNNASEFKVVIADGCVEAISEAVTAGREIQVGMNDLNYNLTLQEAIDAAEVGTTIVLVKDIELTAPVTIGADKEIVLDLNGKTLSGVDTITASYGLINVKKGNLTVKDSVGDGKITLSATNNRGWNAYSSVISNQQGVVTVVSGTIEHTGGTDMAYAIDNLTNSGIGDATLYVEGGVITSTYRAIRQFANCVTKNNNLYITGGEIISTSGNKGAVWLQSSNAKANKATLSITGGSVSSVYVYAPDDASAVNVVIADNCVEAISEAVTAGRELQVKVDGLTYNSTLQEAIDAAEAGETITLVKDIELAAPVTIGADKEIVLDLNGKTLSGVDTITASYGLINVKKGNLTVKDSVGDGKITLSATNNRGWNAYSSVISNQQGVVTVESGTIEHTGGTDMAYAIDNLTNSGIGDATLNVEGGVITSTYRAIRQFANCVTKNNNLYITGGEIISTSGNKGAVWLQSSNAKANKATLSITGGSVSSVYVYAPDDASAVNVVIADNCVEAISEAVTAGRELQVKVDGLTYNSTLQEAIDAAEAGETITLVKDIELAAPVTIGADKEIVLDLNGKILSGVDTITASYGLINVKKGNLTVKDSVGTGKITLSATNNRGWNAYSSVISNQQGVVTVESGTIEHTGGTDMAYAIDNLTNGNGGDAVLNINGGNIVSTYRAIRQFANSDLCTDILNVTGGTIVSTSGNRGTIWLQSASAKANKAVLNITGGSVTSVYVSAPDNGDVSGLSVSIPVDISGAVSEGLPASFALIEKNGVYGINYGISDVEDLVAFRDAVNSGVDFTGKTVELLADIDMADYDWSVNIGDGGIYAFTGTFEGNDHTIKNLNSAEISMMRMRRAVTQDVCTGLFGAIAGPASIQNLTLDNVNIDAGASAGNGVSALVGLANNVTGTISGIRVTGIINGATINGVGAIVGYVDGGDLTVESCNVEAEVNGSAYVGGIVGFGSSVNVANCAVENTTIVADRCAGGLIGLTTDGAAATDNAVSETSIAVTNENWKNSAAVVVGTLDANSIKVSGTNYGNVTLNDAEAIAVVGSEYKEDATAPVASVAATVGDVFFLTLGNAVASANGEEVTLVGDVALVDSVTVADDVVINLNGKTITALDGAFVVENGTFAIKGEGNVKADVDGDNVNASIVLVKGGSAEIHGGNYSFGSDGYRSEGIHAEDGTSIKVLGGSFENWTPTKYLPNGLETYNFDGSWTIWVKQPSTVETPVAETPVAGTTVVETPVENNPVVDTPVVDTTEEETTEVETTETEATEEEATEEETTDVTEEEYVVIDPVEIEEEEVPLANGESESMTLVWIMVGVLAACAIVLVVLKKRAAMNNK